MFAIVNRQFFVMKFESKILKEFNYNINITFEQAKKNDQIIAISDSQMLRSIRNIRNKNINLEHLNELYQKRDFLRKLKHSEENHKIIREIQKEINETMFVPEYLSVIINNNKHYKKMFNNGIIVNNKKYVRFSCSASQARVNTVIFIDEEIKEELYNILNNGRKETKINPSKFNAYFGLSSSSTFKVSNPRVCVIKDCIIKNKVKVNWVTEVEEKLQDDTVELKEIEMDFNVFDGMGLISPEQAQKWAIELELDYIPSQWCIRNAFLKGMLCTFPIHEWCEKINNENYNVRDLYGNIVDLNNVDVILTESQFKMWNCYDSWQQYEENCEKNKLYWGVSIYADKKDKDILMLNYQSLQTIKLSDSDIKDLCSQTVEWISGVNLDNIAYTILFCLGENVTTNSIKNFLNSSDNYWLKCLIANNCLINDSYVKQKIYDLIVQKIKSACLGKLIVDGNYQTIVSDPFALMQHACGLEVTGLLKPKEYYSNYWNNKGVSIIDTMRSPLTYVSEHNILNLKNTEELNYWYKYCYSGIILNIFGDDVLRFADSDFDYDILASTSNKTIINGVYRDTYAVSYEKKSTSKINITEEDLFQADIRAFGSEIGSITNKGSAMYAMLPLFADGTEEKNEIQKRLIDTRVAQGNAIDKAKGVKTKEFPSHWHRYQKIDENDTQEIIKKKELFNKILIEKKPYFFIYLYSTIKKDYKEHVKKANEYCRINFGETLDDIINKKRKPKEEIDYLNNFYRYMPIIDTDCEMNRICHYMEGFDFELKKKVKNKDIDISFLLKNKSIEYDSETFNNILSVVEKFFKKDADYLADYISPIKHIYQEDKGIEINTRYEQFFDMVEKECSNINISTNVLVDIFYNHMKCKNKDFLWKNYGKIIYKNVLSNKNEDIKIPILNENGEINYLGKKYSLERVVINND